MTNIKCVVDNRCSVGESAYWDVRDNCLWWVDIPAGQVYRYRPDTGVNETFDFGEPVGCIAVRESGGLVVAAKTGFYFFDPETGEKTALGDPEVHKPENRFNDGGTDRQGRFWAGTMRDDGVADAGPNGAFYQLDNHRVVHAGPSYFYTTNGLAFSPDGKIMYFSDSNAAVRTVWACDYDIDTGTPDERRVFFDTRAVAGRPDGGTVDAEGCYWMAGIDGWQLVRLTPDGNVDRIVELPVERPSKPMFGGANLDTLFVTSLGIGLSEGSAQAQAGGLFEITGLGVYGLAESPYKG